MRTPALDSIERDLHRRWMRDAPWTLVRQKGSTKLFKETNGSGWAVEYKTDGPKEFMDFDTRQEAENFIREDVGESW
jgi:hypothetical protein